MTKGTRHAALIATLAVAAPLEATAQQATVVEHYPFTSVRAASSTVPIRSGRRILFAGSGSGVIPLEVTEGAGALAYSRPADINRFVAGAEIRTVRANPNDCLAAARQAGVVHYATGDLHDLVAGPLQASLLEFPSPYEGWLAWDATVVRVVLGGQTPAIYKALFVAAQTTSGQGRLMVCDLVESLAMGELVILNDTSQSMPAVYDLSGPAWCVQSSPSVAGALSVYAGVACGLDADFGEVGVERHELVLDLVGPTGSLEFSVVQSGGTEFWAADSTAQVDSTHALDLELDPTRNRLYVAASSRGVYALDVSNGQLDLAPGAWPIQIFDPGSGNATPLTSYSYGVSVVRNVDGQDYLTVATGNPPGVQFLGECAQVFPCELVDISPGSSSQARGVQVYRLDSNGNPTTSYSGGALNGQFKPFAATPDGVVFETTSAEMWAGASGTWLDVAAGREGQVALEFDPQGTSTSNGVIDLQKSFAWDQYVQPGDTAPLPLWAHDDALIQTSSGQVSLYVACEGGIAAFDASAAALPLDDQDPAFAAPPVGDNVLVMAGFPNRSGGGQVFPSGRLYANGKTKVSIFDISSPSNPIFVGDFEKCPGVSSRGESVAGFVGEPGIAGRLERWLYAPLFFKDSGTSLSLQAAVTAFSVGTELTPDDQPNSIGGPFPYYAASQPNTPSDRIAFGAGTGHVILVPSQQPTGPGPTNHQPYLKREHILYVTYGPAKFLQATGYDGETASAGLFTLRVREENGQYIASETRTPAISGAPGMPLPRLEWDPTRVFYDEASKVVIASWTCGGIAAYDATVADAPVLLGVLPIPDRGLFPVAMGAPRLSDQDRPIYVGLQDGGLGVVWLNELAAGTAQLTELRIGNSLIGMAVVPGGAVDGPDGEDIVLTLGAEGTVIANVTFP